jgi:hypothetical protein
MTLSHPMIESRVPGTALCGLEVAGDLLGVFERVTGLVALGAAEGQPARLSAWFAVSASLAAAGWLDDASPAIAVSASDRGAGLQPPTAVNTISTSE